MSGPETVDLSPFLSATDPDKSLEDCKRLVDTLKRTSCLIIKDPRVTEQDNNNFLDMMEKYYEQTHEQKLKDVRPEHSYQVGATPEFVEVPRDHSEIIKNLDPQNGAHAPKGADPKWRYFWRVGSRPTETKFPSLNAPEVVPEGFPQWPKVMNSWGELMMQSVSTVAEMLAIGLNLPASTFLSLMNHGPHLLAPTGSDLARFKDQGQIFAGFHYDLNFISIHGKSRYPGLYIWLRDGTKTLVRVPDGCLLIQAGKQLEWLTGGEISAGFHEVVVSQETLAALERNKAAGNSEWRVSSTLFSHIASDQTLKPLVSAEKASEYPPTLAGDQVADELSKIQLSAAK